VDDARRFATDFSKSMDLASVFADEGLVSSLRGLLVPGDWNEIAGVERSIRDLRNAYSIVIAHARKDLVGEAQSGPSNDLLRATAHG
jgi:hypothetical protein